MGTNFYFRTKGQGGRSFDDYDNHIGKRSAAGSFCWDCNVTLHMDGNEGIHKGATEKRRRPGDARGFHDRDWHSACPKCGAKQAKEGLDQSTGGRELGFNKNPPTRKKGVASCCSFTWAKSEGDVLAHLKASKLRKPVVDEYGRTLTRKEFEEVLSECPVRFNLIGVEFS